MNEDIFESLNHILWDIEYGTLLILEHAHTSNAVDYVLCEELAEDSPNEGHCLESLFKIEFDGDKVFLTS